MFFHGCVPGVGEAAWCSQMIEYIMGQWRYWFEYILHVPIIVIMQGMNALNFKIRVRYILSSVCNIKPILWGMFYAIYGAVCIPLTHFTYGDCGNMCTLSSYHHQIGSMTQLPLFSVRSWSNAIHCMSFYFLIKHLMSVYVRQFTSCDKMKPCE